MWVIRALPAAGALFALTSAEAAPFPSTDQNPLLGGYSLSAPARLPPSKQTSAGLSLNWSSTAAIQQHGDETLVIDAESREWRAEIEHSFTDRLTGRAELPYRTTSAGSLDSTIENWHDFFGLPNGDRSALPRDELRVDYRDGTALLEHADTSLSGIGDLSLSLGYQLRVTERSATSLWSIVTLPTGDASKLTGIDAVAGSLAIAHTQSVGERFQAFGHVGVYVSDEGEPLSRQRESIRWMGMVGAEYRATPSLGLLLQLDVHSAAFESAEMAMLGEAVILSVGADYVFQSKWRVRASFSEDVQVEASPDVTFMLSVGKSW